MEAAQVLDTVMLHISLSVPAISLSLERSPVRQLLIANLILLMPVLCWGLPIPFLDELFDRWDPVLSSALRYWVALPCVYLVWRLGRRPGAPVKPAGIGWWPIIRLSTIGLCGFSVVYSFAVDYMHPVTAAVLTASGPVTAAVVARLLFGQPMRQGFGLAIVLSLVGAVLTTVDFDADGGATFDLRGGEPLFLLAQALWAWYSLEAQRLLPGVSQVQLTLVTLIPPVFVLPLLYVVLLPLGLAHLPPAWNEILGQDIAVQVWLGVFGVAVAIVTWNMAVKVSGIVVSTLYLNLTPVVAVLMALLIGIEPRPLQLVGGAIVLAGIVQAQLRLLHLRRATALSLKGAPQQ